MIFTEETLEAAVAAVGLNLADLPGVLGDPHHRRHLELVEALSGRRLSAVPAVTPLANSRRVTSHGADVQHALTA